MHFTHLFYKKYLLLYFIALFLSNFQAIGSRQGINIDTDYVFDKRNEIAKLRYIGQVKNEHFKIPAPELIELKRKFPDLYANEKIERTMQLDNTFKYDISAAAFSTTLGNDEYDVYDIQLSTQFTPNRSLPENFYMQKQYAIEVEPLVILRSSNGLLVDNEKYIVRSPRDLKNKNIHPQMNVGDTPLHSIIDIDTWGASPTPTESKTVSTETMNYSFTTSISANPNLGGLYNVSHSYARDIPDMQIIHTKDQSNVTTWYFIYNNLCLDPSRGNYVSSTFEKSVRWIWKVNRKKSDYLYSHENGIPYFNFRVNVYSQYARMHSVTKGHNKDMEATTTRLIHVPFVSDNQSPYLFDFFSLKVPSHNSKDKITIATKPETIFNRNLF